MTYEDRVTVATPEGLDLDLHLAGLGSRRVASAFDWVLKGIAILLVVLALVFGVGEFGIAIATATVFGIVYVYDVVFEVLAGGRTPGKMALGLRVLRDDGAPVGLRESAIRNLVRIFEGPATSWIVGAVAILVTRRNQRLGDLAAGTIVVRERRASDRLGAAPAPTAPAELLASGDASAVTAEELAAVRSFLARRGGLDPSARAGLARQLASHLRGKVSGAPHGLHDEAFLEWVAALKAARA